MLAYLKCHLTGSSDYYSLGIGDLIGRSEQAALCIDDPRISEAHAFLSLRGGALMLLALRGRFRVLGKVVPEVELCAGMDIELYKGFWLHCDEVVVPGALNGLNIPGLGTIALTHTSSLFFDQSTKDFVIKQGHIAQADAVFWSLGDVWSYRLRDGTTRELVAGTSLQVGTHTITCERIALADVGVAKTRQSERAPLHLEIAPKSVNIRVDIHERTAVITGVPGKILASVSSHSHPVEWDIVAHQVWPDDVCSESSLRRRFDVGMLRLRAKLQQLDLPSNLVQMDGSGLVALQLEPEDSITRVSS